MTLAQAELGKPYEILSIETEDEELDDFLFTLGCYSGENITVVSTVGDSFVVSIRDGRYNIGRDLAEAIRVS
ncbi:MAG: FeoA family protein [Clostridia bacterium]